MLDLISNPAVSVTVWVILVIAGLVWLAARHKKSAHGTVIDDDGSRVIVGTLTADDVTARIAELGLPTEGARCVYDPEAEHRTMTWSLFARSADGHLAGGFGVTLDDAIERLRRDAAKVYVSL